MSKDWKNVQTTKTGQEYVEPYELSAGPRSSCKAVFFRNTHKSNGENIVSLKIARLKKSGGQLATNANKSITLNASELNNLIKYIEEYYTPLNTGMTQFISADEDTAKLLVKIRNMGISDEGIVDKLRESGILTKNLSVAITAAERNNAVREFEQAIDLENHESFWQNWFTGNKWILGSEYLNILPERDIDVKDIADYLMRSIDGFLDVVEIKRPDLPFWVGPDSHGNWCPSSSLTAAITQCLNYLYRIEQQSDSVDFMERLSNTKTVRPQCMLVYGRSKNWDETAMRSLRILNSAYHQLHIITYDQLLLRAKQLLGVEATIEDDDDEWPF